MDIQFGTQNIGNALLLMLLGMVGIMLAVKLLNRFAKDKNDKDGGDAKK